MEQPPHLYSGARRRVVRVDVLVAHPPHRADLGDIGEVVAELHHVAEAGSRHSERRFEVLEDLADLGLEVALADDPAGAVQGDLAGYVDRVLPGSLHHLGVAGRGG